MAKKDQKKRKSENLFRKLARWFVRVFMGLKYEEKWFPRNASAEEEDKKPDDSEFIVSPARQAFQGYMERKFAVVAFFVVVFMFLTVFIGPLFMPKYSDAYTEVTLKNLPPNLTMMSVPSELKNDIKMIDSYGPFSVGLSNAGKVYVWGCTELGASGMNVKVPAEYRDIKMAMVAAGVDHIIAIGEDGKIYGWGSDRFGQYGRSQNSIESSTIEAMPEELYENGVDLAHVKKLTCGYQATAILMDDGRIYIWGNKQTYSNMDNFIGKEDIVDVDFTLNYVVGITNKRNGIYTGTRGLYDMARTKIGGKTQKMFEFLNGRKIEEITATTASICLLLDDGTIALTGDFPADSIEVPDLAVSSLPEGAKAPGLEEDERFVDIKAGNYHFTALTNHGNVYSFGGDHYYQAEAPILDNVAKIYAGAFQSYAVDANGDYIDAWGFKGFPLGSDDVGANIFERIIAGGRITMTVGAVAVIIEILIGVSLGCISGYYGGWVDILIMRIAEVFSSLPTIPIMLILTSLIAQMSMTTNQRLFMIMVVLGILGWPGFANITRAQILVARESEYVTAAQAMGVKEGRIAFKHILPNIITVILVSMTLSFAAAMQTETGLSFLGFGVNYPQPSWGNMLTKASNATAAKNFWWQWVFTSGILIFVGVCINTIGDTIRDVMDPKSSSDR
ncbi:MAG: ABC transporter permease subunit [Lachnospiraceae bacterium]|nr:ABC transporter permease subunit [Lachnospiraceae bacterium]